VNRKQLFSEQGYPIDCKKPESAVLGASFAGANSQIGS